MINYYAQAIDPLDPQVNAVMPMLQSSGVPYTAPYTRAPLLAPGSVDPNSGFAGVGDAMRRIGAQIQQRRAMAALRRQSAPTGPNQINVNPNPSFGADGGGFGSLYDNIFGGGQP